MNDSQTNEPQTETANEKNTPKHRHTLFAKISIITVLVAVCFLAGYSASQYMKNGTNEGLAERQTVKNDGNAVITDQERTISDVADKVSKSVVSVVTAGVSPSGYQTSAGAGSGIIVSGDGYVMTNKHVISSASKVEVTMQDGTLYKNVSIVGRDPLNDVAFLKINGASNLPAAELGDSSSIRVGQGVVAIGNSLGLYQNTVTDGIISGTGRPISAQDGSTVENLTDLIQTNAAINPGNSGGPLLNLSGQVIGINTAIAEDAQGIGFAIPINATKGILKGVLAGKGVERAQLGVRYITIDAAVAEKYKLSVKKGAYVYGDKQSAVIKGGAADRAGIKNGDIITKVNGLEVGGVAGLSSLVAEYAPDNTIEITVLRNGKELTFRVTLTKYASEERR